MKEYTSVGKRWLLQVGGGLLLIMLLVSHWAAAAVPAPPTTDIYVLDNAQLMQAEDRERILALGEELDRSFGAQLVVVTVNSLEGEAIEPYANRLFCSWGIGDAEKNNGVLLLIAKEDRKFRIEVGYGLEDAITDEEAQQILAGLVPDFREGNYSQGICYAYQRLAQAIYTAYGENMPEDLLKSDKHTRHEKLIGGIGTVGVMVLLLSVVCFWAKIMDWLLSLLATLCSIIVNAFLYVVPIWCGGAPSFHWKEVHFFRQMTSRDNCYGGSRIDGGGFGNSGGFGGGSSGGGGAFGGW
ncbi:TPM domain-containing protein [Selenomonas sp. WCT3]|uniref:TPM domain-containing protein n=1 Tax=Selenomonas sp. WCT3 TaxID=3158785 RepID=UPI000944FA7E